MGASVLALAIMTIDGHFAIILNTPRPVCWEYPRLAQDYHVRDGRSVVVVILGSAANYGHVLFRNCAAVVENKGAWSAHRQKSKAYIGEAEK